jgi:hypothetical protein
MHQGEVFSEMTIKLVSIRIDQWMSKWVSLVAVEDITNYIPIVWTLVVCLTS